ncbi:MAG TPA: cellulase family glycosylhydrolase, partial [Cyclobacteriaceae bacterium]|nr:cellulase family glycosylhydrolase [Cyclobacteriaceae bacterium]
MKWIFLLAVLVSSPLFSQRSARSSDVYVDKNGMIRWSKTNAEVEGFGVNYTAPFAHAYATAKKRGIDLEKAIADDVYHFSRLGLDLYRVHVWDSEISDTLGNLLTNDHTRLFDFMVMKMKERGMKFVITPIAYWGNGWPAPDEKTPGFSTKYGKDACLTNEAAIKAQENYLAQFLNHVNEYTGVAYKNDPDIIAFEICNEPHHRESPEKVTNFVNRMVKSMRSTGSKKPIFYNITHSIQLADAYFDADIQGGTFQWYPTGLGSRHELGGNLLPNVDAYTIPFASNPKFKPMARMVYEFDAADVGRSYIYPAMARSFRTAGMQIANHFAYDPTYMADVNTEYGTHYMNLAYAPQKALSLKIAGEVFHEMPVYKDYGSFPDNTSFGPFSVSYEKDLAVMNSPEKFFYTNTTDAKPVSPDKLEQIAGYGDSELVRYKGKGAYFLDRLENGVWRLEVMPDAIWIEDPF